MKKCLKKYAIVELKNLTFILLNKFITPVLDHYVAKAGSYPGTNSLGLLVFCLAFGHIIGKMGDRGTYLQDFFKTLSKAFLEMIRFVIW